ncbi:cysteine-rich secretory protein LCCL domain-containing [Sarotherodon galilaeus]
MATLRRNQEDRPNSSCWSSAPSAAAASWASGHTRPQPPSHIESPPPPQKSLQIFFILLRKFTGSAWLHLL